LREGAAANGDAVAPALDLLEFRLTSGSRGRFAPRGSTAATRGAEEADVATGSIPDRKRGGGRRPVDETPLQGV